jgi:hypothetical protein
MFELWQSLEQDCIDPSDKNLGCSEQQALHRLERVLGAHGPEMDSLKKFATSGDNRVVIVPGNHDGALMFPRVAKRVLDRIGAPADRIRVETKGYWLSGDGLVYAKHGHQIGKEVNRVKNWPKPFLPAQGVQFLERPWGEQFVQRYYNQFEAKYPIVDNFGDDTAGLKYAFAAENVHAIADVGKFLKFYVLQVSMRQFLADLGSGKDGPKWDLDALRAQGSQFLLTSLEPDDEFRRAAEQAGPGDSPMDLSDDEITGICNYREELFQMETKNNLPVTITRCPAKDLGALKQKLFSTRDAVFGRHLDDTLKSLSAPGAPAREFQVFVYSHTHLADPGFVLHGSRPRRWNPSIVNSGAWQRTVTQEQMAQIQKDRKLDNAGVLKLLPEDLPACYPYLVVVPYTDHAAATLKYWNQNGQKWEAGDKCLPR